MKKINKSEHYIFHFSSSLEAVFNKMLEAYIL